MARLLPGAARHGTTPDDPEAGKYLPAYLKMRISGSLLDHLRSCDWVTRSERTVMKRLQQAELELGGSSTLAEQAAHAGVDLARARAANTAADRRPTSLDEAVQGAEYATFLAESRLVDESMDSESQGFVHSVLDRVAQVIEGMDEITQHVLIFKYVENIGLTQIAGALGIDRDGCQQLWQAGILMVHDAMLKAAAVPWCADGGSDECSCAA